MAMSDIFFSLLFSDFVAGNQFSKVACKQSDILILFRDDNVISANHPIATCKDDLNSEDEVRRHVLVADNVDL